MESCDKEITVSDCEWVPQTLVVSEGFAFLEVLTVKVLNHKPYFIYEQCMYCNITWPDMKSLWKRWRSGQWTHTRVHYDDMGNFGCHPRGHRVCSCSQATWSLYSIFKYVVNVFITSAMIHQCIETIFKQ